MSKVYTINTGNKAQFLSEYALLSGSRITGSLFGTASWAQSSSVANSASFAPVGPGTVNSIALFNSSTTITSSNIFQSSNNIGIGTTSPLANLSILSSIYDAPGATDKGAFQIGFANTNGISFGTYNASPFANYIQSIDYRSGQSNTYPLVLNPIGGNVGIGTTSPSASLSVVGGGVAISGWSNNNNGTAGGMELGWDGTQAIVQSYNRVGAAYTPVYINGSIVQLVQAGNEKMRVHTNGYVGIGTTNPLAQLSVGNGSLTDTNVPVQVSAGGTRAYYGVNRTDGAYGILLGWDTSYGGSVVRSVNTSDTLRFVVNNTVTAMTISGSSGNVGIGTTSPLAKLEVTNGNIRLSQGQGGAGSFGRLEWQNTLAYSSTVRAYIEGRRTATQDDGFIDFATSPTTNVAPSVSMTIDNNGNVGIGTISPAKKLQVVGDANVSGSLGIFSVSDRSGTGTGGFYRSAGINRLWDSTFGDVITWDTSGNVGIGTTNPGTKLDVIGTSRARTLYAQGVSGDSGNIIIQSGSSNAFWISGKSNAGGAGTLHIGANGPTEPTAGVIVINTSNNVGIGTTNFSTKLQVSGSIVATAYNEPTTLGAVLAADGTNALLYARNGSTSWSPMYIDATTLYLNAQSSGNVGIGTTSPSNRLQIQGNVSASSYTSSISNAVGFFGTASRAVSSSRTDSASRADSSATVDVISGGSTTGLGIYSGSFFGTASWSNTASFALNAGGATAGFPFSGNAVITGSLLVSSSGIVLSGSGLTGSVFGTSSWANTASVVTTNTVSYTAGAGLSGGGTATLGGSSVTIDAVAGAGISLTAPTNDAININTGSTHFTDGVKTKLNTDGVFSSSAQVNHNTTTNYVANQHIDHTSVSISAGNGLTGGGTIAASRTLTVRYVPSTDDRATNSPPASASAGLYADFKENATDGLSDGGLYHGVLTFRPYGTTSDFSGGPAHQLGFTERGGLYLRTGSSNSWGSWGRFAYQTGSIFGTASFAISSSFTTTASFATSASFAQTGGAVANALTFSNTGNGAATGTTYNGSVARTISYNSVGAIQGTQTAYSTITSGSSGDWFPLFAMSETVNGPVYCSINTYAHSSVSFIAVDGYGPSNLNHIVILGSVWNANSGYANISGVRITDAGIVQVRLTWTTGPLVDIDVALTCAGTPPALSANLSVDNSGTINDSVDLTTLNGYIRTENGYYGGTNLVLNANGASYLNGGSIGIGTTSPSALLHISASGTTNDLLIGSTGSPKLFVSASGNIGINTLSPAERLRVNGTFASNAIWTTGAGLANWGSYSTAYGTLTWDVGYARIHATAGNRLDLGANGSNAHITITGSGNVGIGTINPATKLHVQGLTFIDSDDTNATQLTIRGTTNTNNRLYIGYDTDDNVGRITAITEGTAFRNLILQGGGGNVGIGTSSPAQRLDVSGSIAIAGTAIVNTSRNLINLGSLSNDANTGFFNIIDSGKQIQLTDGTRDLRINSTFGGSNAAMGTVGSHDLNLFTANSFRVTITSDGNVGIGTTSPSNKLQIQGNVSASSYTSSINNGVGFFGTASRAVSASRADSSGLIDVLSGGSTTGLGIYSGSFSGSFFGTLTGTGGGSGAGFPYSGSAVITGSLLISGSGLQITGSTTTSGSILPAGDNVFDLGSSARRWANLYTGDLVLSNEGSSGNNVDGTTGNWTVQEGDAHLYIINNKSGKKYKFVLEEIE